MVQGRIPHAGKHGYAILGYAVFEEACGRTDGLEVAAADYTTVFDDKTRGVVKDAEDGDTESSVFLEDSGKLVDFALEEKAYLCVFEPEYEVSDWYFLVLDGSETERKPIDLDGCWYPLD